MILDLLFVFILTGLTILGYYKGFTEMFLSLFSIVLSLIIAFFIYEPVSDVLYKTDYVKNINYDIYENINETIISEQNKLLENTPFLSVFLEKSKSDDGLIDYTQFSQKLADSVTKTLVIIPSYIIVFLLSRLIIFIIRIILKGFSKLPLVNFLDSILGMLCGFFLAIAVNGLIFTALMYIQFIPELSFIQNNFDSSIIILLINDFIM